MNDTTQIIVRPGSIWRHYKGPIYVVTDVTNGDGTRPGHPNDIVYRDLETWDVYSRPLDDWCRSFTQLNIQKLARMGAI